MSLKTGFLEKKFKGLDKLRLILLFFSALLGLPKYFLQFPDYLNG